MFADYYGFGGNVQTHRDTQGDFAHWLCDKVIESTEIYGKGTNSEPTVAHTEQNASLDH